MVTENEAFRRTFSHPTTQTVTVESVLARASPSLEQKWNLLPLRPGVRALVFSCSSRRLDVSVSLRLGCQSHLEIN